MDGLAIQLLVGFSIVLYREILPQGKTFTIASMTAK